MSDRPQRGTAQPVEDNYQYDGVPGGDDAQRTGDPPPIRRERPRSDDRVSGGGCGCGGGSCCCRSSDRMREDVYNERPPVRRERPDPRDYGRDPRDYGRDPRDYGRDPRDYGRERDVYGENGGRPEDQAVFRRRPGREDQVGNPDYHMRRPPAPVSDDGRVRDRNGRVVYTDEDLAYDMNPNAAPNPRLERLRREGRIGVSVGNRGVGIDYESGDRGGRFGNGGAPDIYRRDRYEDRGYQYPYPGEHDSDYGRRRRSGPVYYPEPDRYPIPDGGWDPNRRNRYPEDDPYYDGDYGHGSPSGQRRRGRYDPRYPDPRYDPRYDPRNHPRQGRGDDNVWGGVSPDGRPYGGFEKDGWSVWYRNGQVGVSNNDGRYPYYNQREIYPVYDQGRGPYDYGQGGYYENGRHRRYEDYRRNDDYYPYDTRRNRDQYPVYDSRRHGGIWNGGGTGIDLGIRIDERGRVTTDFGGIRGIIRF